MGQKVNPVGMRVGVNRDWNSHWFAEGDKYALYLNQDIKIRKMINEKVGRKAFISHIDINRVSKANNNVTDTNIDVTIYCEFPGIIQSNMLTRDIFTFVPKAKEEVANKIANKRVKRKIIVIDKLLVDNKKGAKKDAIKAEATNKAEAKKEAVQVSENIPTVNDKWVFFKKDTKTVTRLEVIKRCIEIISKPKNKKLEKVSVNLSLKKVEKPYLDATIVANHIAEELENRESFRKAQKKWMRNVMKSGAKGIRTVVSGRLAGADIARKEGYKDGIVPLHTLRSDIDFAVAEAATIYGRLGVKIWICRGEIRPNEKINKVKGE